VDDTNEAEKAARRGAQGGALERELAGHLFQLIGEVARLRGPVAATYGTVTPEVLERYLKVRGWGLGISVLTTGKVFSAVRSAATIFVPSDGNADKQLRLDQALADLARHERRTVYEVTRDVLTVNFREAPAYKEPG